MFNFKIKRKLDFFLSVCLFFAIVISMGSKYAGIGFPEKESLSYTTGILNLHDNVRNTKHVAIDTIGEKRETQVFACGYTPFDNGRSSDCGFKRFFEPYINKEVTIGWYKQNKVLIFENNIPQLVTIQSGNETVRSYASTVKKIRTNNRIYLSILIFAFPLSLFMYWAASKLNK